MEAKLKSSESRAFVLTQEKEKIGARLHSLESEIDIYQSSLQSTHQQIEQSNYVIQQLNTQYELIKKEKQDMEEDNSRTAQDNDAKIKQLSQVPSFFSFFF